MEYLPSLVAHRVKCIKCFNTDRESVIERYMKERAALEMKYSDLCKPLYKERRNVFARRLDDEINRIHEEVGGKEVGGVVKGRQRRRRRRHRGRRGEGGGRIPGGPLQ